jgi:hypothetical protein
MADKKKTVKVHTAKWHTYKGKEHNVGDEYQADEQDVETLRVSGFAYAVEPSDAEKAGQEHREKEAAPKDKRDTSVEPLKLERKDVAATKR